MKIEVLIHGPRHMLFGPTEHEKYASSFYVNDIKENVRFVVDIINSSKPTAYYTYARYGKFFDVSGRPGQYLGLTLCVTDGFIPDLEAVYLILDRAFNMDAVGLIVDRVQEGYKYRVDSFSNIMEDISISIEKRIETMLSGLLRGGVCAIPKTNSNSQIYTLAIGDTKDTKTCNDLLQQYSKLVFVSDTLSIADKGLLKKSEEEKQSLKSSCEKQIIAIKTDSEKVLQLKNDEIEKARKETSEIEKKKNEELSQLTKEAHKLKSEKTDLNRDLDKAKSDLKRATDEIKSFKEDKQKLDKLKSLCKELEKKNQKLDEELSQIKQDQFSGDKGGGSDKAPDKLNLVKTIATFVNSFLCIATCVILCLFVWGKVGVRHVSEPVTEQHTGQSDNEVANPTDTTVDNDSDSIMLSDTDTVSS